MNQKSVVEKPKKQLTYRRSKKKQHKINCKDFNID